MHVIVTTFKESVYRSLKKKECLSDATSSESSVMHRVTRTPGASRIVGPQSRYRGWENNIKSEDRKRNKPREGNVGREDIITFQGS